MKIRKESCETDSSDKQLTKKLVLKGEIHDLNTISIHIPDREALHFVPPQDTISIFLFTHGMGKIKQGKRQFNVMEIAVYVPACSEEATFISLNGKLEILEIILQLSEDDKQDIKNRQDLLPYPYFVIYSKCKKYKESIKSDKTINHMLLPENIVPRFCMGAVQTYGPDRVGSHAHPMLEQLFFGLNENDCVVTADRAVTSFEENVLLHIPLGSEHGIRVEEGKMLNYIWMDFFHTREDMGYMAENHIMKGD